MRGGAHSPFKRYLPWVAGAGLFGVVTVYVAQEAAAQLHWWEIIPWGVLTVFFLGGLVGTFYADCINPNSSLHNWWQMVRAVGDFGEAYNQSLDHDLGADHGGKQQFISIYVPFTFNRHTEVDAIRLTSQVHSFDGRVAGHPRASYNWKVFERTNHHKGDKIDIPIAHVPADFSNTGVYGDMDLAGYYLSAGSAHLVTIELLAGKRPQSHKIMIILPSMRITGRQAGRAGEVDPGGRLLVFQEGRTVFPQQSGPFQNDASGGTFAGFVL
jgi:hypothetical protein